MKSLILTAQDARDLETVGGLTITKPIKPTPRYIKNASFEASFEEPGSWYIVDKNRKRLGAESGVADIFAPTVQSGDVVLIREPWYRLRDPNGGGSDRFILAADSSISEDQVAYKWSSPVSMPEEAARRFARVVSAAPIYNESVTVWEIELEKIRKEAALEEENEELQKEQAQLSTEEAELVEALTAAGVPVDKPEEATAAAGAAEPVEGDDVPGENVGESPEEDEAITKAARKWGERRTRIARDLTVDKLERVEKEQPYLFVFEDDTTYEMQCGISLKDAVWEMAKYTGNSSEMFRKSLFSKEFKDDDVNDIINLFNHWCYYSPIKAVYVVREKIYTQKENA